MGEEPKEDNTEKVINNLTEAFQEDILLEGEQLLQDVTDDVNGDELEPPENIGPIRK